jgi:protoporphyrinogen oxidase
METVKVIIVGGGAAGLGAAKTLGSNVNYLLIEAQDYLGGRIRTVDAGCRFLSLIIFIIFIYISAFDICSAPNVVVDLVKTT